MTFAAPQTSRSTKQVIAELQVEISEAENEQKSGTQSDDIAADNAPQTDKSESSIEPEQIGATANSAFGEYYKGKETSDTNERFAESNRGV